MKETNKQNNQQHLLLQLMDVLWILHGMNPNNVNLAPVVVPGLKHTEQVVYALIEIVHAFNTCDTYSNVTIGVYLQLLLCKDAVIAFSAKQALCKVLKPKTKRRRVFIPSPPHCVTPPPSTSAKDLCDASKVSQDDERTQQQQQQENVEVDDVVAIGLLQQQQQQQQVQNLGENHNMNPLEALLGGGVGFPPLLGIPPDADDETMVELAIALSLQDHEIFGEQAQVLGNEVNQPNPSGQETVGGGHLHTVELLHI